MNIKEKVQQEARRLEENQKEFEQFKAIAEKLPDSLNVQSVTRHAHRGSLRIQLDEVENVGDVRALLIQFPPVKLIRYKDSCTSFLPSESLKESENKRIEDGQAEETLIAPVVVDVDQIASYPTNFEARWWSHLCSVLCQIEVRVRVHPLRIVPKYESTVGRGGKENRIKTGYELAGLPGWDAQITKYASGSADNANPFVIWWHWDTDDETKRPEGYFPEPWQAVESLA